LVEALFARLDDEVCWVRVEAAQYTGQLGKKARPALPRLIHNLKGPHSAVRAMSARALIGLGRDALEALPALRALAAGDSEPNVRLAAEEASREIGKIQSVLNMLPYWIKGLREGDPAERVRATGLLREFGPLTPDAVPDLIRALDDPEPKVRRAVADAWCAISSEAAPARRKLAAMVRDDPDESARRAASEARRAIDPATGP
jgi:HEAT repeat protein